MKQDDHKNLAAVVVALVGIGFGALSAVAGLAIEHLNVTEHGASTSAHRYELFALPALPGFIISERRFGPDFQLGEIQGHRASVIGWNALLYGAIAFLGFLFLRLLRRPSDPVGTTTRKAEQGAAPNP